MDCHNLQFAKERLIIDNVASGRNRSKLFENPTFYIVIALMISYKNEKQALYKVTLLC